MHPSASDSDHPRYSLHIRFLLAFTLVGFVASFTASLCMTFAWAERGRRQRATALDRMVRTLATTSFPFSHPVLIQMQELTGAEFLAVNREGKVLDSTCPVPTLEYKTLLQAIRKSGGTVPKSGMESTTELKGKEYRYQAVPLKGSANFGSDRAVQLIILMPEVSWWQEFLQALGPAAVAAVGATLLSVITAAWLSRRISRPLQALAVQTVAAARDPAFSVDLPNRNDELRDLAVAVNDMLRERRSYENALREEERRRSIQQVASALAHQLRNYATAAKMALELHMSSCSSESSPEELSVVRRQIDLMDGLLRQFLCLDASPPSLCERADLASVVKETVELSEPGFRHAGVALELMLPDQPAFLSASDRSLRQIVANLIHNALQAARDAPGRKKVTVHLTVGESSDWGRLEVIDSGVGVPEHIWDKLFHSPVTTKVDGCGLGLLVAARLAAQLGGNLSWERRQSETVFTFRFPLQRATGCDRS